MIFIRTAATGWISQSRIGTLSVIMHHERSRYTVVTKTDQGATLWLADSLSGPDYYRLNGDYKPGEVVKEFAAGEGLGELATALTFERRSNGDLNWCGIAFFGDVVKVAFLEGETARYDYDELREAVNPFLEENTYRVEFGDDEQDEHPL